MISLRKTKLAIALIGAFATVGCQSSKSSAASTNSTDSGPSEKAARHAETTAINVVKNGILKIDKGGGTFKTYDSTTVGKAFDGTFQDSKWTSFETDKGATVVEFNGSIKQAVLRDVGFYPIDRRPVAQLTAEDKLVIPATFQFKLSVDQTKFELSAMDWNPWLKDAVGTAMLKDEDAVLSFIYH